MRWCFFHSDLILKGRKSVVAAALICLVVTAVSCRSVVHTVERPVYVHDTTFVSKEVHDSTFVDRWNTVYQKGDTVYVTQTKTVYRERIKTDTVYKSKEIPVEVKVTETVEVAKQLAWWQKALMYIGVFFLVGLLVFFILLIVKTKT